MVTTHQLLRCRPTEAFLCSFSPRQAWLAAVRVKRSTTPPGQRSLWVLWIEKLKKMLPNAMPKIPHTLSSAAPTKAAQIRSAVTGALIRESLGLLCFEHTVETTFLLPWDLNPKVWRFK